MAESFLCIAIDKLAGVVTPLINEELKLQRGIAGELKFIKGELQMITAFLKDAEEKAEGDDVVKAWVSQVRNIAYRIEDVIDEHIMYTYTRLESQPKNPCLSIPYKAILCFKDLKPRHKIGSSIAEIKAEILNIRQRKDAYRLRTNEQGYIDSDADRRRRIQRDPRVGFLYQEDSDLVGIEHPRNEIFEMLNIEVKDMKTSVVAMTGMGGIGKTTLAWKVYENIDVKRYFYVRAWVTVSPSYSWRDLLRNMRQQLYKTAMQAAPAEISQKDEIDALRNFLQDKRYMVVFDDVWDHELWSYVESALPNNNQGSKILLTTRQETVARNWKDPSYNNYIYKLKLLPPEKAWELFCKKAFQGDCGEQCPQWLEEISHSIVDKCEGLPLALVAVGGLLSTKEKSFAEWRTFRDSLGSEVQRNPQLSNITRILLLSYKDLPHYLKPCLVYFGMFPEDSSIDYNRLVKLWTAEDFIQRKRGITIEDVARTYLLELTQRSLVQVSVWYDCGRARAFRVHDLLHEILRPKLEELNFCQILEEENLQVDVQTRRLSVQEGHIDDASSSITSKCNIRSLFLFGAQDASTIALSSSLLNRIYLLKVLDLQGAPLEQIPEEVGNLFLLQYISVRFTKVKSIPKSIGKLQNLLTLDLKRCPVLELPVEIGNLKKLRHFVIYQNKWHDTLKIWVIGAVTIPGGALGSLVKLQKLADINVAKSVGFMDQLSNYRELRYLAISNVRREDSEKLCKAIEKLNRLESLNITVDYGSNDPLDLQHVMSPPIQLQRLYLVGPLEKFPHWISRLENLNKLRFKGSKLRDIPFEILQKLPNLTMLGINKDVYYGERLVFQVGGFKKLKAMYFNSLINLNSVEIPNGALPLLEDLLIQRSRQLKEVPFGLQYLKKLTSLKIVEMPEEFVDSIQPGASLHYVVKHVADIRVGYQTPTGQYIYKKL